MHWMHWFFYYPYKYTFSSLFLLPFNPPSKVTRGEKFKEENRKTSASGAFGAWGGSQRTSGENRGIWLCCAHLFSVASAANSAPAPRRCNLDQAAI
jgi:hypothetical protein